MSRCEFSTIRSHFVPVSATPRPRFHQFTVPVARPIPVKITLNSSIPEDKRPQVEAMVRSHARVSRIVWLPSRFPRYVMLLEPGPTGSEPPSESIFDSPRHETDSPPAVAEFLEQRIKAILEQG